MGAEVRNPFLCGSISLLVGGTNLNPKERYVIQKAHAHEMATGIELARDRH
jgi:hypothetical protein